MNQKYSWKIYGYFDDTWWYLLISTAEIWLQLGLSDVGFPRVPFGDLGARHFRMPKTSTRWVLFKPGVTWFFRKIIIDGYDCVSTFRVENMCSAARHCCRWKIPKPVELLGNSIVATPSPRGSADRRKDDRNMGLRRLEGVPKIVDESSPWSTRVFFFLWGIRYTLREKHGYIGAYILVLNNHYSILFYWTMNMQKWMRNSFLQVEDRFKCRISRSCHDYVYDSMLGSTPGTFCLSFVHWRSQSNQPFIKGTLPAVFWFSCPPWIPRPQKSTKEVHCDDVELKTVEHHDDHKFS